jgi:hypothetical protein
MEKDSIHTLAEENFFWKFFCFFVSQAKAVVVGRLLKNHSNKFTYTI